MSIWSAVDLLTPKYVHELLHDPDRDVVRAAASCLGEWGDVDALDDLVELLEGESEPTPLAAAVTFIGVKSPTRDRQRVLSALDRFSSKSAATASQVKELRWRLVDQR